MKNGKALLFHALPLLVVLFPPAWFAITHNESLLKGEGGIIENLTVLFLFTAIGFYIANLARANRPGLPATLKVWLVVLIIGSTYFMLEEISYGQHLIGWDTADGWKELNDQDETNLHNVHPIFDQIPRGLLTLAILVGGVILPIYRRFRKIELTESNRLYWQWPTIDCVTVGLLVILIRPVLSMFDADFINTGELKENLFALFILLYGVSMHGRLKRETSPSDSV